MATVESSLLGIMWRLVQVNALPVLRMRTPCCEKWLKTQYWIDYMSRYPELGSLLVVSEVFIVGTESIIWHGHNASLILNETLDIEVILHLKCKTWIG